MISSGYMHAATVAPDGSNAQVVTLTQEAVARINYLSTYSADGKLTADRPNRSCTTQPQETTRGTQQSRSPKTRRSS